METSSAVKDGIVNHLGTAALFTLVTVLVLGILYPLAMTGVAQLLFPSQANGSLLTAAGKTIGSDLIGQLWTKPQYFHGRPSAAGKGYDPTSTGGTNFGPTSKKLIDATSAAIVALKKENPDTALPVPMDLVTSSASGIDPDVSPEAAYYQVARVAKARGRTVESIEAIVRGLVHGREFGFLGEAHVNVLELNLALDAHRG
jgi:K+-transporting ATPase ATPase C chain